MTVQTPLAVLAYAGVARLLHPAAVLLLARRARRGKEDPDRIGERRGIAGLPRPAGALVWLHGASVGELVSLIPVVEGLIARGAQVLVTSGTVTSAEVARRRLPAGAMHQYVPLDLPAYVERFIGHWRPDIGVFAESELWPNLIRAAHVSGTALLVVNGRMSERSHRRWKRFPSFITWMLSRFTLVLAQTEADGARLRELGAPHVEVTGNLKFDAAAPPADPAKLAALTAAIGGRPVFVAASTHPGEEEMIGEAHLAAMAAVPGLLTVIAPRHPARGAEAAAAVARSGLAVRRRSEGALPDAGTEVYLADTIGELGLFYRCSRLSFLGGSLVPHGGQNPIEPAKLGNAILHGPHVFNFRDVYAALTQAGGALPVADGALLGALMGELMHDEARLEEVAQRASACVEGMSGAVGRTLEALEPFLSRALRDRAR